MTKANIRKLVEIAGDLEDLVLNNEGMSRSEIDIKLSSAYVRMTEVVGSIMLEHDEMSGVIE